MRLDERIQLLVIGFLLLLAVSGAFGAVAVGRRDKVLETSDTYKVARTLTNRLLTNFVDQETGVRGYVITRDASFLVPYRRGSDDAAEVLARLKEVLGDQDLLMQGVARIEASAERWRTGAAQPEIQATATGRTSEAQRIVATGEGQALFNRLRADVGALLTVIEQADADAERELAAARRQINQALVLSFASGALLLLVASVALQRWSTRPLAQISAAARDVAAGQLDRRIPAVGPRDIADLGQDAEAMRRRIVAELDSARRAEQALRSKGAIVSLLRRELSPTGDRLPASLSMAAGFEPVKGVLAGDWYDVLSLDDGRVALCLIDVSGHGQATGIFALQAKNLLLAGVRQDLDPGAALAWMARALGDTGDDFLTCFVARIDPRDGGCEWASAGHLPTLLVSEGTIHELGPTGPLLGPLPGRWDTATTRMTPGSVLLAYTDGVTEARSADNEEFGEERLRAVAAARAGEHPSLVIQTALDTVHDFAAAEIGDDLTIVALRWLPQNPPTTATRPAAAPLGTG